MTYKQNSLIKIKCPYCLADSLAWNIQKIICKVCELEFPIEKEIPILFTSKQFPIVLVGGKSGIGKTHLVNQIVSNSNEFRRPHSYTTREKRENEQNEEYIFISKSEFEEIKNAELLINEDVVYGNSYGITLSSIISNALANIISIKEVHPRNFFKFNKRGIKPLTILITDDSAESKRSARSEEDYAFYQGINTSKFDIVFDKSITNKPDIAIEKILDKIIELSRHKSSEQVNNEGYSKIASEFYDDKRITTANFHQLTEDFFASKVSEISSDKVILDLGCGTGYATEILRKSQLDTEIIVCDLSVSMLEQTQRHHFNIIPICCSAFNTPFEKDSFDFIFSSLCDPFCTQQLFEEVKRILKINGNYILSVPSKIWAEGLRIKDKDTTEFVIPEIGAVKVYSFTPSLDALNDYIKNAGLEIIRQETKFGKDLKNYGNRISQALVKSANNLGINIDDLPVINLFQVKKHYE